MLTSKDGRYLAFDNDYDAMAWQNQPDGYVGHRLQGKFEHQHDVVCEAEGWPKDVVIVDTRD